MRLYEFNATIEEMRKAYPFRDEQTELVDVFDIVSRKPNKITIKTYDNETDTEVTLTKVVDVDRIRDQSKNC